MSGKSVDLGRLCRTCMLNCTRVSPNTKKHKKWIYEKPSGWNEGPTIMELLRSVQPAIQIDAKDKLPKIMCHDCIEQLKMTYEFLQMCEDSDEKFRKIVKEDDTTTEFQELENINIKEEVVDNGPILKYEIEDNAAGSQHPEFSAMLTHNSVGDCVDWMSMETSKNYLSNLNGNTQQDYTDGQYSEDEWREKGAPNDLKTVSDEIKFLKETVNNQNRTIVELVSEIKVMLQSSAIPVPVSQKYSGLFPISCFDKLKEVENEITDDTKHAMISTLKGIIGNCGIKKELEHVMDISIILAFNVDGKQNKLRLLQYPKFIDSLYRAVFTEGLTQTQFLKELRQAFRLAKNRYHKKQSLKRNRPSFSSDDEQSEELED